VDLRPLKATNTCIGASTIYSVADIFTKRGNKMMSEPEYAHLVFEHKRDPIHGHEIFVSEWSDDTWTVTASIAWDEPYSDRRGVNYVIDNDDSSYDHFPTDEEIQLHLEEVMEAAFENPGSISHVMLQP